MDVEQTMVSGKITIDDEAVASIVGHAALGCYGVVGMTDPSAHARVRRLLSLERVHKGVEVKRSEEGIIVRLFVVLEYGVNLVEVARNLIEQVTYLVKSQAGITVETIEVYIRGIKD